MGRPFAREVEELEATHRWAWDASIEVLSNKIREIGIRPLLSVGSGGSFTTATVAATLFRDIAKGLGIAVTPQALSQQRNTLRESAVLIATASGSNPDAVGVLKIAASNDAGLVLAICTRANSKLADVASKFSNATVAEFQLPTEGDGFLATNSLWASSVLLIRAFCEATGNGTKIPKRLATIVGVSRWSSFNRTIEQDSAKIWDRSTTIVLYGPTSYPAAVDLESKLTEAALKNVWIADYRHFAHGRHHWIAKRRNQTSIIAFVDHSDSELADRTLAEIPHEVPVFRIEVPDGPIGILKSLAHVFPLISSAGQAVDIDPGRPGVPSFGRKIYRLNAYGKLASKNNSTPTLKMVAIGRKTGVAVSSATDRGTDGWQKAYQQFVDQILNARFSAIVFDYDGTLCSTEERRTGLRADVADELSRLLRAGLRMGIATGRGKSVREALCNCLPQHLWQQVTIGYYNGGQIASLDEIGAPDGEPVVEDSLNMVWSELRLNDRLREIASIEGRRRQITIETSDNRECDECWQIVQHIAASVSAALVKVVRSSHSVDVIPADVSKTHVIETLKRGGGGSILAIGDMGRWPGNDFELLNHEFSLSVDQVSPVRSTCWNLARPGIRGVDATLEYLARLHIDGNGHARIKQPPAWMEGQR